MKLMAKYEDPGQNEDIFELADGFQRLADKTYRIRRQIARKLADEWTDGIEENGDGSISSSSRTPLIALSLKSGNATVNDVLKKVFASLHILPR